MAKTTRLKVENIKRVDQYCLHDHVGHIAVVMNDGTVRWYMNYDVDNMPETVQKWWDDRRTKDKWIERKLNGKKYDVIRYYR